MDQLIPGDSQVPTGAYGALPGPSCQPLSLQVPSLLSKTALHPTIVTPLLHSVSLEEVSRHTLGFFCCEVDWEEPPLPARIQKPLSKQA